MQLTPASKKNRNGTETVFIYYSAFFRKTKTTPRYQACAKRQWNLDGGNWNDVGMEVVNRSNAGSFGIKSGKSPNFGWIKANQTSSIKLCNKRDPMMIENNLSWRHHYLPQFYIRGFTNSDGSFKIFDVINQRFLRDGKDFSPESFFFEKDGNTYYKGNAADDFIETKFYAEIDSRIAELFNRIKAAEPNTKFGLSDDDMPAIQHFISVLFWRNPTNYDQVKHLISTKDLSQLGLTIVNRQDQTTRNFEMEEKLKNDPEFFKVIKFWLPFVTFNRLLECRSPLTVHELPFQYPALCSDNPIIFQNTIYPDIYFDNLILPLSHHLFFFRGTLSENLLTTIKMEIDLLLLKQAKKYVSCTDTAYISFLNQYYSSNYSSVEELRAKIFKKVFE